MTKDKAKIEDLLNRSVDQIEVRKNFEESLGSGKKLRIKLGIDPTAINLHLGHAILLLKLKKFQELGHQIVLIVGDFTGVIGDTSDKESERPMLSPDQIKQNMKTYLDQVGKLLDVKKAEIRYNSEWLQKLDYLELSKQADVFSLNEFISRTNIKNRLNKGSRISIRELIYPLMQAYDSVAIKADVELGGSDQWFNLLAGRALQKFYKQPPQNILTVSLLLGTDGRKMSSSWGNTINVLDEPKEMFGKVMSISDDLIIPYFTHCTEKSLTEIKDLEQRLGSGENQRDLKEELALTITELYWGKKKAKEAQEYFITVFQNKSAPAKIKKIAVKSTNIVEVLTEIKLARSKTEARKLIDQGGIKINGQVIKKYDTPVKSGNQIQKGKRKWLEIE